MALCFVCPPSPTERGGAYNYRPLSFPFLHPPTQRGDSPIHKKVRYIRTRKIPELPALLFLFPSSSFNRLPFFSLRHQSFSYRQGCLPKRMFFFSTKHTNISLSPQKSKNFFTASKHIRSFLQLRFRTLLLSRLPLSPLRLAQLEQHFFSFSGVWDSVSFFSSHFPLFVAVF